MFVMEHNNRTAEACFVRDSVTWQTRSEEQFKESHNTTESFYREEINCIDDRLNGTSVTNGAAEIRFNLVDPIEFKQWSVNMSSITRLIY